MAKRDGRGGFKGDYPGVHCWTSDKYSSNAYIIWALLETGEAASNLKTELAALKGAAETTKDSYVSALAANALFISGDKTEAKN